MNLDEFAFFNQQLAAMLRDGIPLEGALRQLADGMRHDALKAELTKLEADLASGASLAEAIARRNLPELYKRMVLVGARGNNLPGILALLADYYQQRHSMLTRLKGLMVYPALVLIVAFIVSGGIAWMWSVVLFPASKEMFWGLGEGRPLPAFTQMALGPMSTMWVPPLVIGLILLLVILAACIPPMRASLRWRLPAFKESSVAQCAAAMNLLLRSGVALPDAIGFLERVEGGSRAGRDLHLWRTRLAGGIGKFAELARESRVFPPLFVWLVANAGEDIAAGFEKASSIYAARATYRTEMLLYAALPACVLMLGLMILSQAWFTLATFLPLIDLMNNLGG
jgi:type IV pilus assembly protein PilC